MLSRPLNGWTDFSLGQEVEERKILEATDTTHEIVHVNMLDFCKMLYNDIWAHVDAWSAWDWDDKVDTKNVKKQLEEKLNVLKELIVKKECYFGENRGFF